MSDSLVSGLGDKSKEIVSSGICGEHVLLNQNDRAGLVNLHLRIMMPE